MLGLPEGRACGGPGLWRARPPAATLARVAFLPLRGLGVALGSGAGECALGTVLPGPRSFKARVDATGGEACEACPISRLFSLFCSRVPLRQ